RAFTECAAWRQDAFRVMGSLHPAVVLMSTRTYQGAPVDARNLKVPGEPNQVWTKALLQSAAEVKRLGARVALLQDTPDPLGNDVPDCVAAHPKQVQQCALPVRTAIYPNRVASIAAAAKRAGIAVIDPTSWFCTATTCPAIVGNTLVYRDGSHVSTTYIALLA